ncbi:MAG: threonylcarbamoyl-AMP synthase, partial [Chloroflexi bacterium RBG_13_60_13]
MELNPAAPDPEAISRAAESLRKGGLVAFPTETVYGLGADALNAEAVRKIFAAKGRPLDNPIIVHVAGPDDLGVLTDDVPPEATMLIRQFWPGPLTLIFKKSGQVPGAVTGGQDTVAVRMPRNAIALALVRASGRPIAAPSANLSGRPSPTTAGHVLDDLGGKIDIILDGGPVEVGIESTVLDLSQHPPVILRPGAVTREELKPFIGEVVAASETGLLRRSPGTRYRHYSPRARVTLVEEADQETMGRLAA